MADAKDKLSKQQLAEIASGAMNLLNDLRCHFGDDFSPRQENDFHGLAWKLPEAVRMDFMNNGTIRSKDIALLSKPKKEAARG